MIDRRSFVAALGAACLVPVSGSASAGLLTAGEALAGMQSGKLLLVDIRTPEEWKATGVADGAWPLDMRTREFGPSILAMIERNPKHQIAVICRTGNRSGYLVKVLAKNGIHGILDVTEGMAGGRNGRGWIPSGLPIVNSQQALDGMPQDLRAG